MTADTTANAGQIAYWNEVAGPKWVANQESIDRLMAPLTEALLAGAAATPGEHALDIGCGCGDLSLRLAAALGPLGHVTGIDLSQPMLAHAAARAERPSGAPRAPIEWCVADAMTHVFEPEADLLISRFGVMFFEDQLHAFGNLRSALKPGGRFAFLTWRRRSDVEWMQVPMDWIAAVCPMPNDVAGEVGPFGLADAVTTGRLLQKAGFQDISAEPVDRPLMIGATVEEAFRLLIDTGPAAGLIREAEPEQREAASRRLRDGIEDRLGGNGIRLGGACWLYRGMA